MRRRAVLLVLLVAAGVLHRKMKGKNSTIVLKKGHYTAKAVIVWCFDARASQAYRQFLGERGWSEDEVDLIRIAGGAHDLASPEQEIDRAYVLGQLRKSALLHKPEKIVLMAHIDCGAYNNNSSADFYRQELQKAAAAVRQELPDLAVELVLLGFDGSELLK